MRVGAGAHRQVVLAGEAKRLVVVRLEEEARVVDLEHVDLGQVAMERRRVGDRVAAVEGVREIDQPALCTDGRDRVRERHAAWDLLLQEETDHFALLVGLDLFAGDDDEVPAARLLDRLEGAAECVVVGDRDRTETLLLGVVEQLVDLDRAVVRPARVHVQVAEDPVALGERRLGRAGATTCGETTVQAVELGGDFGIALDPLRPGGVLDLGTTGDRLEPQAGAAARGRDERSRGAEDRGARSRIETR